MTTVEENELLTRVGPGTPMGTLLRRYWVPALLATELDPDGPPVRVKLLGEPLVAFRDTAGRVGILDLHCAHRRASLFLGRNEANGLRCIYHGWKYGVGGQCLDMPNEPPESKFEDRVQTKAYPTVELGGIVWTYMGPKDNMPAPPAFDMTRVPATHRDVTRTWEECNWLQALEGGIDIGHVMLLHFGFRYQERQGHDIFYRPPLQDISVEPTSYGFRYWGIRPLEDGHFIRGYHFVMPWTQIRPTQATGGILASGSAGWQPTIGGHFWVPIDDENCMAWTWSYSFSEEPLADEERSGRDSAGGDHVDESRNFRKKRDKAHDYAIDRVAQRDHSFTGIEGTNTQDHAVQESMGIIVDRTSERLGNSDRAIVALRQLLWDSVRALRDGDDPPGVAADYYRLRGIERHMPSVEEGKRRILAEMLQEV